ncbi:MAG: hypothetical protein NXI31_21115 [bacterium]|nr:hypothetical protein [bacterium]
MKQLAVVGILGLLVAANCERAMAQESPAETPFGPAIERAGKRFEVVFQIADLEADFAGRLADQALLELEQLGEHLEKSVGARFRKPYTVVVLREAAAYVAAQDRHGSFPVPARPPDGPTNQWSDTNGFLGKDQRAYVRMGPHLSLPALREVGLPPPTIVAMMRVAAEVVLHPLVRECAAHDFVVGVLAMGTVETLRNPGLEYDVDAAFDRRRETVIGRRLLGDEFSLDTVVDVSHSWEESWQWGVAQIKWAVLAQCLRQKDPRWARKLVKWRPGRRIRGREDAERRAAITAVVGRDWAAASHRFATMVDAFAPRWSAFRDVWAPGKRGLLVGMAEYTAGFSNSRPWEPGAFAVSARVELGPGETAFMIDVSHAGGDRVTACFHTGKAGFYRLEGKPLQWIMKVDRRVDIRPGKPFDTRVQAELGRVHLFIDDVKICSWEHGFGEPDGRVDMMVGERLVWLENLRFEPLKK